MKLFPIPVPLCLRAVEFGGANMPCTPLSPSASTLQLVHCAILVISLTAPALRKSQARLPLLLSYFDSRGGEDGGTNPLWLLPLPPSDVLEGFVPEQSCQFCRLNYAVSVLLSVAVERAFGLLLSLLLVSIFILGCLPHASVDLNDFPSF